MTSIIDAHIHLDQYEDEQIAHIMSDLESVNCTDLISVSFHLESCKRNLLLADKYPQVKPAFGFHPEQNLPSDGEVTMLFDWITKNSNQLVAIGEVGLPHYLRAEVGSSFQVTGYIELLESFIKLAKSLQKPLILHAVYDDAPLVCDLLETHNFHRAHFHWFKGDYKTIERMVKNDYYISLTPDVLYEEEIRHLAEKYPIERMMVETDGPWPFTGGFSGMMTHPKMIHHTVREIARIKQMEINEVYRILYTNTKRFYNM